MILKPRVLMSVAVVLALTLGSICHCMAATPDCSTLTCATHRRDNECSAHHIGQKAPGNHDCCKTVKCGQPAAFRADPVSLAGNYFGVATRIAVRSPVLDVLDAATPFLPVREAGSGPPAIPVFLKLRTLLL